METTAAKNYLENTNLKFKFKAAQQSEQQHIF